MHDIKKLLELGCKKQKLRAPAIAIQCKKANDWALSFGENFDIQAEAKGKKLALNSCTSSYVDLLLLNP